MNPPEDTQPNADLEVVSSSKGRKPGGIVSVRLSPEDYELLVRAAEADNKSLSETLRAGLRCLVTEVATSSRITAPQDATRAGAYNSLHWTDSSSIWALTNS